jgi:hypothetical protein
MKLIYSDLNSKFDMCVIFMTNYFLVGDDIFINGEAILVTDFVNLKIKLAQSFRGAHRDSVYMHIFIGLCAHTYISIYVCTVFIKKARTTIEFSSLIQR